MSSTALPRSKDFSMNDHTKLGLYLLFPPAALWAMMIFLMVDSTLASYVFARMNMVVMDMVFLIAGFIFPGAALVAGVRGLSKKTDVGVNLPVVVISVLMVVMMATLIFAR